MNVLAAGDEDGICELSLYWVSRIEGVWDCGMQYCSCNNVGGRWTVTWLDACELIDGLEKVMMLLFSQI